MIQIKIKAIYLIVLLALVQFAAQAQVSIGTFLGSATTARELEVYTNQLSYLNKADYRLAPVRSMEIRSQNNQLGSGKQQYGLRISPANPWEIKYTNKVFRSQQTALGLQKELQLKEELARRYELVADFIYLNEMVVLREAMLKNTEHQTTVLEKLNGSSYFDAEDFIELKLEQLETHTAAEAASFELTQKKKSLETLFPTMVETNFAWNYAAVIPLNKLEKQIDSLMAGSLFTTRLAYRQEKLKLADYEHLLQKANINPGFIQTEYMPFRFGENQNPMGVSMGITIPLFNPNKADMAQKKLDILEAQSEFALEKEQADAEVKVLLSALKVSLARYRNLENKLQENSLNNSLGAVKTLTQSNPLILLKYHDQLLKLQKLQLELKNEIYQTYIKLLTTSDLINQKPLVNFLSPNLQAL